MDKSHPPEILGVFNPVGHVVASFPSSGDVDAALDDLARAGFSGPDVTRYSPEQMKAQVEHDVAQASPIAAIGQELNLVKAHGALADKGYGFLVVKAPKDEQAQEVAEIVRRHRAERAQRYGRFIIEELIEEGPESQQVFESPDRGLDAQTRSGREEERARR